MDINIKFKNKAGQLVTGKNEQFRLLSVEGIETGQFQLYTSVNAVGDGSKTRNRKITSKPMTLEIKYVGLNNERERRRMIELFNVHNQGTLTVQIDNTIKSIDCEIESFNFGNENINEPLRFMVSLFAPDPYFREQYAQKAEIAKWVGGFSFPLSIPAEGIEMGYREPSLIANVFNGGHVETGLIIKFRALGSVVNPQLFNINTREYFKVNMTMEGGDVVTIDTNTFNKSVILTSNNVDENYFNWIDRKSTFLQLGVGDNLFRYDADQGLDNLEVDIYFNPRTVGV